MSRTKTINYVQNFCRAKGVYIEKERIRKENMKAKKPAMKLWSQEQNLTRPALHISGDSVREI